MRFDNIIEKRTVDNGSHSLVLEISKDELNESYGKLNNEIAEEIVTGHLVNRGDDGRASDIKFKSGEDGNLIRIYAKVNYLGNEHTEPGRH